MVYIYNGKMYRSYKHPILEYIFNQAMDRAVEPPDEIIFTYEDVNQAMSVLGIQRHNQASISNFVIDLTRKANDIHARVPDTISSRGYDLDRVPERRARQGVLGRLVRQELKPKDAWITWPLIAGDHAVVVPNVVPGAVRQYLGKDEGALLSVMDYCDVLSLALSGARGAIHRVQHPKKWQPGEVDGLYYSDYSGTPTLYPVEAKALSTGDSVNLAQVEGAYRTTVGKITNVLIVPLAVQMIPEGMYIAVFEATEDRQLVITQYLKVLLNPPIDAWAKRAARKPGKHYL